MNDNTIFPMSIMYAKAYGIYFVVVGLGLIFNYSQFRSWYESLFTDSRRVLFGGTFSLLIGCFIVATHNVIVLDWPIIDTLIGYWGILSGAGSLIVKDFIKVFKPMIESSNLIYRLSGMAWLLLGAFLLLQSF